MPPFAERLRLPTYSCPSCDDIREFLTVRPGEPPVCTACGCPLEAFQEAPAGMMPVFGTREV